jgi:hypothetical protein
VSIRRVSHRVPAVPVESGAPAQAPASTSAIAGASPIASSAAAPTAAADACPLSERVVESTRHLRRLGEGDLRMIQETLTDKLEEDPQFLELAQQASKLRT